MAMCELKEETASADSGRLHERYSSTRESQIEEFSWKPKEMAFWWRRRPTRRDFVPALAFSRATRERTSIGYEESRSSGNWTELS